MRRYAVEVDSGGGGGQMMDQVNEELQQLEKDAFPEQEAVEAGLERILLCQNQRKPLPALGDRAISDFKWVATYGPLTSAVSVLARVLGCCSDKTRCHSH